MRRILVPVDGSPSADRAVQHLIRTLRAGNDDEVHLLHVQRLVGPLNVPEVAQPGLTERLRLDAADQATMSARRLLEQAAIRHVSRTEMGDPGESIAMYALVHSCSEIVMGTREMGAMHNLLLGSVAMEVLHLVSIPVTLVK